MKFTRNSTSSKPFFKFIDNFRIIDALIMNCQHNALVFSHDGIIEGLLNISKVRHLVKEILQRAFRTNFTVRQLKALFRAIKGEDKPNEFLICRQVLDIIKKVIDFDEYKKRDSYYFSGSESSLVLEGQMPFLSENKSGFTVLMAFKFEIPDDKEQARQSKIIKQSMLSSNNQTNDKVTN